MGLYLNLSLFYRCDMYETLQFDEKMLRVALNLRDGSGNFVFCRVSAILKTF